MGQPLTVRYAAELMGCTPRSVLRHAAEGQLRAIERPGRYRGRAKTMIDVDSLPEHARRKWREALRLAPVQAIEPAPQPAAAAIAQEGAPEAKLPMARFRFGIIEPLLTGAWARAIGTEIHGVRVANRGDYIRALAAGEWTEPSGAAVTYSESGIYSLLRRFRARGLAGLATQVRADRGETKLPRIVQDFALAAYCSGGTRANPELRSMREVVRLLDEERAKRDALHAEGKLLDYVHGRGEFEALTASGRGWAQYAQPDGEPQAEEFYLFPRVSYTSIARFLAQLPEPVKEFSRRGLEAYKTNCERTIVRDYAAIRCMEYVIFDHRRCDLFVALRRHGRQLLVRPWETVAMDMRSRTVLASVMTVTPSSMSIASCIRAVITRWGLFNCAYFDNGKDFRSHYIDGQRAHESTAWRQDWKSSEFADTRGVLARLGISVIHAIPYSGRSKPIEPSFRNPAHFERSLAGACGNRPHNRPEGLSEMVAEFRRYLSGEAQSHPFLEWDKFRAMKAWFYLERYNREPHTGREMRGRSPEQVIREEYAEQGLARMVDARALDLLMQKRKLRVVGNGGTFVVSWGGQDYVYSAPELWLRQGQQLETGYDPEDLGELVVYEPGAAYVCTARCSELRHMGEEAFREDIAEQRSLVKQTRNAIAQMQRMAAIPTVEERMEWSRKLNPPPLSLAGAPPTTKIEERYEHAAAAAAAAAASPAPAEIAKKEDEELAFLEF